MRDVISCSSLQLFQFVELDFLVRVSECYGVECLHENCVCFIINSIPI